MRKKRAIYLIKIVIKIICDDNKVPNSAFI